MAALMYLMQNRRAMNRERIFRDCTNPLELGDNEIIARYRLPRAEILDICDLLRPDLERDTLRTNALSVSTQVFATLQYLATGSFQQVPSKSQEIYMASVNHRFAGLFMRCVMQCVDTQTNIYGSLVHVKNYEVPSKSFLHWPAFRVLLVLLMGR